MKLKEKLKRWIYMVEYWMNMEITPESIRLKQIILKFLKQETLTHFELNYLKGYIEEWLDCAFLNKEIYENLKFDLSRVKTTKALRDLGYHSITDMRGNTDYIIDFVSDFEYETSYDPIVHCSFEEFKSSFDAFYDSSDEYFIIYLHDWTFLDEDKELDETKTDTFEEIIDYMKNKDVKFMTIEEAYIQLSGNS